MKRTGGTILNHTQQQALEACTNQLRLRNYSPTAIKTYTSWFVVFLTQFPDHKPSRISHREIKEFLSRYRNTNHWSATVQNQRINSIEELLGHNSLRTTMQYTHVSKKHLSKIQSPLDKL